MRAASEWSLRLLVIGAALYIATLVLREFSQIIIPLLVAVLLAAILVPITRRLARVMPTGAAAGLTVLGVLVVLGGLFTLIGQQFSSGFLDLTAQVAKGLEQIRDWVRTTFNITDTEFDDYFESLRDGVSSSGNLGRTAASVGLTATHFIAGTFIALFALFFFL